jgi:hypothetical protein
MIKDEAQAVFKAAVYEYIHNRRREVGAELGKEIIEVVEEVFDNIASLYPIQSEEWRFWKAHCEELRRVLANIRLF